MILLLAKPAGNEEWVQIATGGFEGKNRMVQTKPAALPWQWTTCSFSAQVEPSARGERELCEHSHLQGLGVKAQVGRR